MPSDALLTVLAEKLNLNNSKPIAVLIMILPFVIFNIGFFIYVIKEKKKFEKNKFHKDISVQNKIKNIVIINDYDELKEDIFDIYKKIQQAKNDVNLKTLRKYTTDKIYKRYVLELDQMRKFGNKRVLKDITLLSFSYGGKFKSMKLETGIKVGLHVKQIDYTFDLDTNKVLYGETKDKVIRYYNFQFIAEHSEEERICESCGAVVEDNKKETCPYCKAKLPNPKYRWLLDETDGNIFPIT